MSMVPSIADSAVSSLQRGWAQLDRGAGEVVAGSLGTPAAAPADRVDVRSGSPIETEPMLAGVRDLMLARVQISAGAVLLHAYGENRQSLYDMLKP